MVYTPVRKPTFFIGENPQRTLGYLFGRESEVQQQHQVTVITSSASSNESRTMHQTSSEADRKSSEGGNIISKLLEKRNP
ncbi:unnamed protein product [Caenorhabditis auriculariae]|uniref:Uncharacterized protein n=1 Tax=Caenorhabditis auriculariae TaxID=2777116 RepID=A0A8S1HMB7_9PELO|nr:unnamed protein product [Caenorhabditis auriculariae]